jgi:hypothetical protein
LYGALGSEKTINKVPICRGICLGGGGKEKGERKRMEGGEAEEEVREERGLIAFLE